MKELTTTLRLGDRRSAVHIESLVEYDIFSDVHKTLKEHNRFRVYKGKKFFDLIGLKDPWNFAISKKFKDFLELNNVTGWDCYPIIIEKSDLQYYVFQVIAHANLLCKYDKDGDMKYGTIRVEKSSWDGSDIFLLGKGGIKVVSDKLRLLIEKAKITNVEFEELEKY